MRTGANALCRGTPATTAGSTFEAAVPAVRDLRVLPVSTGGGSRHRPRPRLSAYPAKRRRSSKAWDRDRRAGPGMDRARRRVAAPWPWAAPEHPESLRPRVRHRDGRPRAALLAPGLASLRRRGARGRGHRPPRRAEGQAPALLRRYVDEHQADTEPWSDRRLVLVPLSTWIDKHLHRYGYANRAARLYGFSSRLSSGRRLRARPCANQPVDDGLETLGFEGMPPDDSDMRQRSRVASCPERCACEFDEVVGIGRVLVVRARDGQKAARTCSTSNRPVNPGITSAVAMPVPSLTFRRYEASAPLAQPNPTRSSIAVRNSVVFPP